MDVRKTIPAGQPGSKRWLNAYGNKLINVRYRYDDHQQLRYTTVEIIVEKRPYVQCSTDSHYLKNKTRTTQADNRDVYIRIAYMEINERVKVKAAGGFWDKEKRLWQLDLNKVKELGLENRIIEYA